jgi:CheY-like chemotaxis protein
LIAEAGMTEVHPGEQDARARDFDPAIQRESASFLSTRLLRELIAADARSEAAGDAAAARADALLAVAIAGLELVAGAVVTVDAAGSPQCVAARGVPDHARELLEAPPTHLETVGGSLVQRALAERRVLLLDRSTREPLMPAMRDGSPDVEAAAIVPLLDHAVPVGVLVLGARAGRLNATLLRSLAVAFRLFGLLLAPGRGKPAQPARSEEPAPGSGDAERYLFEIEELTARLNEAREAERLMQERVSSADAALRAEVETSRARIAELEAQLAGAAPKGDRVRELEELCAIQARTIDEREQRVAELEGEIEVLLCRIEDARSAASAASANGATRWEETGTDGDVESEAPSLELPENGDEQLGDIAAAAAAALGGGDGDASAAEAAEEVDLGDVAVATEPLADVEPALTHAVLHLDSDPEARALARETSEASGAAYWCGEGEEPRAATTVAVVNLLGPALGRALQAESSLWSADRWIVYGTNGEGGGFDLGSCGLLRRPIDPQACVDQIRRGAGRKLGGIVLVSAQLRELAGLRQALQEVDAAGSVACDTRQALDLLDIVRRPDAVVIDLALPQGQGLSLAAQLRRQPDTADLPLLLLLPAQVDGEQLRRDADKAQLYGPFANEDVRRLVRATLAGRL